MRSEVGEAALARGWRDEEGRRRPMVERSFERRLLGFDILRRDSRSAKRWKAVERSLESRVDGCDSL